MKTCLCVGFFHGDLLIWLGHDMKSFSLGPNDTHWSSHRILIPSRLNEVSRQTPLERYTSHNERNLFVYKFEGSRRLFFAFLA